MGGASWTSCWAESMRRTIVGCDRCGSEPAESFLLDLGQGRKALDLCEHCQKETGLIELARVLAEFGVISASQTNNNTKPSKGKQGRRPDPRTDDPWPCTVCDYEGTTRTIVMNHLQALHGRSKVAASQELPPRGESLHCVLCGYLTKPGTGYSAHVSADHGPEAWAKIKGDQ